MMTEVQPKTMNLKEETVDFMNQLIEQNYCDEDMYNFISEYGEDNFVKYYEKYVELGEEYVYNAVDAFIEEFSIDDLNKFEDAYMGVYDNPEQFVYSLYEDIPGGLVIDWTETWSQNYSCDYVFCNYCIFRTYF
jgi:hypothetical protein